MAILLAVCVVPVLPYGGSSSAEPQSCQTHTVVYHPYKVDEQPNICSADDGTSFNDCADYVDIQVTYSGSIVSTEYNPQVWAGSFTADNGQNVVNWYPITEAGYSDAGEKRNFKNNGGTLCFTGWVYATGFVQSVAGDGTTSVVPTYSGSRYPGEVMSEEEIHEATDSQGRIHVYATWGYMANFTSDMTHIGRAYQGEFDENGKQIPGSDSEWISGQGAVKGGNHYTNIVRLPAGTHKWDGVNDRNWNSSGFTIRGQDGAVLQTWNDSDRYNPQFYALKAEVILDNITLIANQLKVDHGEGGGGLLTAGSLLIIGTDVRNYAEEQWRNGGAFPNLKDYVQIFGSYGTSDRDYRDRDIFGDGTSGSVKLGSVIIIHSGRWANVVGGNPWNGYCNYISIRDAEVLDSLVGASTSYGSSPKGNVFIYATGVTMRGDDYTERALGYPKDELVPFLGKPTLIVGGCNNERLNGDTHVFVSGHSYVWDVTGAGRRAGTSVSNSNVEISGEARVNHLVCGSVADGIRVWSLENSKETDKLKYPGVTTTSIDVKDRAAVASVFGAGYDHHAPPDYPSMFGSECKIHVKVEGGTVGYVYGGGYRGNVGYINDPIGGILVEIAGGTVLGDVFGGGRGGLDKLNHVDPSGVYEVPSEGGPNYTNGHGNSAVFAKNVSVSMTGGTVLGSVYGGGESVPGVEFDGAGTGEGTMLDTFAGFYGITATKNPDFSRGKSIAGMQVASMKTDALTVEITGGTVKGNVCGGGKGVDVDDMISVVNGKNGETRTYHSTAFTISIKEKDGAYAIERIPYFFDAASTTVVDGSGVYEDMASVSALGDSLEVKVDASGRGEGSVIGGSVFGGGLNSRVGDDSPDKTTKQAATDARDLTAVRLGAGCTVSGDVHGGGYGSEGLTCTNLDLREVVIDGANVLGSVYGGSRLGWDNCQRLTLTDTAPTTSGFQKGLAIIRVVSGNIAQGGSGNVYGGGYKGYSNMDAQVLVGVPAWRDNGPGGTENIWTFTDITGPAVKELRVHSVLGGSSIGEGDDKGAYADKKLLLGDTRIVIGNYDATENGYANVYADRDQGFSVTGDVFGEGDLCGIGGKASITFSNFEQTDGLGEEAEHIRLLAIQRAESLTLYGSEVHVTGGSDSLTAELTSLYSVKRVDTITLQESERRCSLLDVRSTIADVGYYHSLDKTGANMPEPKAENQDRCYNTLVLRQGSIFAVLLEGENDPVNGYTMVRGGGDSYYGITLVSWMNRAENEVAGGFLMESGGKRVKLDREELTGMWFWLILGVHQVEGVVELTDTGESTGSITEGVTISAPRFTIGSQVYLVGYYVVPYAPDSLNLVDSDPQGNNFVLNVGKKPDGTGERYLYYDEYGKNVTPTWRTGGNAEIDISGGRLGSLLRVEVTAGAGFATSGYVGKVVLHMVETSGASHLLTGAFDVEVSIYLHQHPKDVYEAEFDLILREEMGLYSGFVDAHLTTLPGSRVGVYTITNVTIPEGSRISWVTVSQVANDRNDSGWLRVAGEKELRNGTSDLWMGDAAVLCPMLRFEIRDLADIPCEQVVYVDMTIVPESGQGSPIVCKLTLRINKAVDVDIVFYDHVFEQNPVDSWHPGDHVEVLKVTVQFGTAGDSIYVAVNKAKIPTGTNDSEYMTAVVQAVGNGLLICDPSGGGNVVCSTKKYWQSEPTIGTTKYDSKSKDTDGNLTIWSSNQTDTVYTVMTLEDFVDLYVREKPSTTMEGETFRYSDFYRFYDSKDMVTRFNFSAPVVGMPSTETVPGANRLTEVYIGYKVVLTVIPVIDGVLGKDYFTEPSVNPAKILVNPGSNVTADELSGFVTPSDGFRTSSTGNIWFTVWSNNPEERVSFTYLHIYGDRTLYLLLEPIEYTLDVKIIEMVETTEDAYSNLTVTGANDNQGPFKYHEPIIVSFVLATGWDAVDDYRVYPEAGAITYKKTGQAVTFQFRMPVGVPPAVNDHDVATFVVNLFKGMLVVIQLPETGIHSNDNGDGTSGYGLFPVEGGWTVNKVTAGQVPLRGAEIVITGGSVSLGLPSELNVVQNGVVVAMPKLCIGTSNGYEYRDPGEPYTVNYNPDVDVVHVTLYVRELYRVTIEDLEQKYFEDGFDHSYEVKVFRLDPSSKGGYMDPDAQSYKRGDVLYLGMNALVQASALKAEGVKAYMIGLTIGNSQVQQTGGPGRENADGQLLTEMYFGMKDVDGKKVECTPEEMVGQSIKDPVIGVRKNFVVDFYSGSVHTPEYRIVNNGFWYDGMPGTVGGTLKDVPNGTKRAFNWNVSYDPATGVNYLVLKSPDADTKDSNNYLRIGTWNFGFEGLWGFKDRVGSCEGGEHGEDVLIRFGASTVTLVAEAVQYHVMMKGPGSSGYVETGVWDISRDISVGEALGNPENMYWDLSFEEGGTSVPCINHESLRLRFFWISYTAGSSSSVGQVDGENRLYFDCSAYCTVIVVFCLQSEIGSPHGISAPALKGWTGSTVVDGVELEFEVNADGTSLTIRGCPEGTGSLSVVCNGPPEDRRSAHIVLVAIPDIYDVMSGVRITQ